MSIQSGPQIVLVLPTYLPESFGGAEQQARKLSQALSRMGARVTILAPRLNPETPARQQDANVALRRFHVWHGPNLGGRHILSLLAWAVKLGGWLARHRHEYDVIHIVHGRLHALPAVLAGAMLRKPTLIKIGRGGRDHFDLDLVQHKRLLGPWYARMMVRHATAYVANSQEIAADLQRWHIDPKRVHLIPNGVEIPELPNAAGREGEPVACVYLGRLDPEKSVDLLIRGFARIPADRARLTIVGDGTCRSALQALVEQLGAGDRIEFTGAVEDVSTLLRSADIFVSASASEGMSNALLEAMSYGVVPLVSKVSGVGDIVQDDESGLLFTAGDLPAFERRLAQALALPRASLLSLGSAARARVAERFGIELVARQHLALYETLRATAAQ